MASNRKWVVRILVWPKEHGHFALGHTFGEFLEQLRYMGLAKIHKKEADPRGDEFIPMYLFDLYPPIGITDTIEWAKMNARRMESFGYNAIAAPEWKNYENNPIPTEKKD